MSEKVIFITFELGSERFWREKEFRAGREKFVEVIKGRFGFVDVKEFEPIFAMNQLGLLKLKNGEILPMEMVEKLLSDYQANEIVIVDKCQEKELNEKIKAFISKHKNFYSLEEVIEDHHKFL